MINASNSLTKKWQFYLQLALCLTTEMYLFFNVQPPDHTFYNVWTLSFPVGRRTSIFLGFRFPQGDSAIFRTISDFSSYLLPLLPKQGVNWFIWWNWTFSPSDSFSCLLFCETTYLENTYVLICFVSYGNRSAPWWGPGVAYYPEVKSIYLCNSGLTN